MISNTQIIRMKAHVDVLQYLSTQSREVAFPKMVTDLCDRFTYGTLYRRVAQLVLDKALVSHIQRSLEKNTDVSWYTITDYGRQKLEVLKRDLERIRSGQDLEDEYPKSERLRRWKTAESNEIEVQSLVKRTANSVFDLARITA